MFLGELLHTKLNGNIKNVKIQNDKQRVQEAVVMKQATTIISSVIMAWIRNSNTQRQQQTYLLVSKNLCKNSQQDLREKFELI